MGGYFERMAKLVGNDVEVAKLARDQYQQYLLQCENKVPDQEQSLLKMWSAIFTEQFRDNVLETNPALAIRQMHAFAHDLEMARFHAGEDEEFITEDPRIMIVW